MIESRHTQLSWFQILRRAEVTATCNLTLLFKISVFYGFVGDNCLLQRLLPVAPCGIGRSTASEMQTVVQQDEHFLAGDPPDCVRVPGPPRKRSRQGIFLGAYQNAGDLTELSVHN